MSSTALFYMTDQCTLCEEALETLLTSKALGGWTIQAIDIAQSDDLFQVLGERIPLIEVDGIQLDWPFTETDLLRVAQAE